MIIKNKKTKETLNIKYNEFFKIFASEIQIAYENFEKTEFSKNFLYYKNKYLIKSNFYFQLQWNFNHFSNSNWYIEKL